MTLQTYDIVQLVEMAITHRVRAENQQAANAEATRRTARACASIAQGRSRVSFGDIQQDYVPADQSSD